MDIFDLVHNCNKSSRRYTCRHPGCGKVFTRNSDLGRHARIHSDERNYGCTWPDCGKTFIQRSAAVVHMRVHTGERPHACLHPGCSKAFGDSSSLARHRRIHTGARPYQCHEQNCHKTFCRKITLVRHQEKQHSYKTPPATPDLPENWDCSPDPGVASPAVEPVLTQSEPMLSVAEEQLAGLGISMPGDDCCGPELIVDEAYRRIPSESPAIDPAMMDSAMAEELESPQTLQNPYPTPDLSCTSSPTEPGGLIYHRPNHQQKSPVYLPPLRLLHSNASAFEKMPVTPALPTPLRWSSNCTDDLLASPRPPESARFESNAHSYHSHPNYALSSYGHHNYGGSHHPNPHYGYGHQNYGHYNSSNSYSGSSHSSSSHRFDFSGYSIQSPTWPYPSSSSPSYGHPHHLSHSSHNYTYSPTSPRGRFPRSNSITAPGARRESYSQFINAAAFPAA